MSFWAFADALKLPLPCPEKMVLAVLCHYASDDGEQACWASKRTVAFTVGVSEECVRQKIKCLMAKGYVIDSQERPGQTTRYILNFQKIKDDGLEPPNDVDPPTTLTPQPRWALPPTTLGPPPNDVDPTPQRRWDNKQMINNEKQRKTKASVELPFSSAEFLSAWKDWNQYLKEKKKKLTPSSETYQLRQLSKTSEADAIARIEQSITNNWVGLFPVKESAAVAGDDMRFGA